MEQALHSAPVGKLVTAAVAPLELLGVVPDDLARELLAEETRRGGADQTARRGTGARAGAQGITF